MMSTPSTAQQDMKLPAAPFFLFPQDSFGLPADCRLQNRPAQQGILFFPFHFCTPFKKTDHMVCKCIMAPISAPVNDARRIICKFFVYAHRPVFND